MVQYKPRMSEGFRPVSFTIDPKTLVAGSSGAPNFLIHGKFDSTRCSVSKPLTGFITVNHCESPIRSLELQLVRVETCGCAEGYARDGKLFE